MNNEEHDMLVETHADVKHIKEWVTEHNHTHSNYIFWVITALVAAVCSWFRLLL